MIALPGPGLTKLRPPVDPRSMVSRSPGALIGLNEVSFPGVRMPDRVRDVDSDGVRIRVLEWGALDAPPLLLAHGGMDFALTLAAFAPLLADGGWRVVSWDQRCHGDSDWAPMSGWASDIRDAAAVLDATSSEPVPILGHSKGGNLIVRLAEAWPHRFSHVVNIDGLPSTRTHAAAELTDEDRTERLGVEVVSWLDHRRRTKPDSQRKPGTLEELARRRATMNPRLTHEWLCYLASTGAALSADGWRWKIDPMLRAGGFGPWKPEWAMHSLPGLPMPFLAFLGLEYESMGWGTQPEDIMRWLPEGGRLIVLEDTGHFVHIEQPGLVSNLILEFLGTPVSRSADGSVSGSGSVPESGSGSVSTEPTGSGSNGASRVAVPAAPTAEAGPAQRGSVQMLNHARLRIALHCLRSGSGQALLLLHGLGEQTVAVVPAWAASWTGPVYGLDFTGHGLSDRPAGGGYNCELLMADVDTALEVIGAATIVGRGLGGYVGLLIAGARPKTVRGLVITDGVGLAGGGVRPGAQTIGAPNLPVTPNPVAPDPFVFLELTSDVRPADYALNFLRSCVAGSDLALPVSVASAFRPPWLQAVCEHPSVNVITIPEALAAYSAV